MEPTHKKRHRLGEISIQDQQCRLWTPPRTRQRFHKERGGLCGASGGGTQTISAGVPFQWGKY